MDALIVVDMQVGLLNGAPGTICRASSLGSTHWQNECGAKAAKSSGSGTAATLVRDLSGIRYGEVLPI